MSDAPIRLRKWYSGEDQVVISLTRDIGCAGDRPNSTRPFVLSSTLSSSPFLLVKEQTP